MFLSEKLTGFTDMKTEASRGEIHSSLVRKTVHHFHWCWLTLVTAPVSTGSLGIRITDRQRVGKHLFSMKFPQGIPSLTEQTLIERLLCAGCFARHHGG